MPDFSRTVDAHHAAERNPWPLWLRHRMVVETLRAAFPEFGRSGAPLAGHRLDLDWQLYRELLPPDRIFAVPLRDDFEDAKAKAWTALGERVERIDVSHLPEVSGTLVRERLASGLPRSTTSCYRRPSRVDGVLPSGHPGQAGKPVASRPADVTAAGSPVLVLLTRLSTESTDPRSPEAVEVVRAGSVAAGPGAGPAALPGGGAALGGPPRRLRSWRCCPR